MRIFVGMSFKMKKSQKGFVENSVSSAFQTSEIIKVGSKRAKLQNFSSTSQSLDDRYTKTDFDCLDCTPPSKHDHIRDVVTPQPLNISRRYLKIISWNISGIKALKDKNLHLLTKLVETHRPDVLCLQETKLQAINVNEYKDMLAGYSSFWSCCAERKGYSGSVVFINRNTINDPSINTTTGSADTTDAISAIPNKAVKSKHKAQSKAHDVKLGSAHLPVSTTTTSNLEKVTYDLPPINIIDGDSTTHHKYFKEGRLITTELNNLIIVSCYAPTAGDKHQHVSERVEHWDKPMRTYLNELTTHKPVIFCGDMNIGHLDLDMHNAHEKRIVKQSEQERQSHLELLVSGGGGFRDSFRYFYPDARGQFTYWSSRTNSRPTNRGIRLDTFICSENMYSGGPANGDAAADILETARRSSSVICDANNVKSNDITNNETNTTTTAEQPKQATRRSVSTEDIPSPGVFDCYCLHEETVGCSDHAPVVLVVQM